MQLFLGLLCSVLGKKVIAVMGATGQQGGALVDAILADGTFQCRAITRSASSEKAQALLTRGCEVVEADANKPATLTKAFEGAEGAFLLTNYWECQDKEYKQATDAADAAISAGVKHIVWSTLESVLGADQTRDVIPKIGNTKVPHFDEKDKATRYMKSKLYPVTYLFTTFFMENFYSFGMLSRVDDSHYEIVLPTTHENVKLAMVSTRDIGLMALSAFKDPANSINQDIKVLGDFLTPKEIGAKLEKAAGVKVAVKQPQPLEFAKYGFPGAEDLGHMFLFYSEYEDIYATYHHVEGYENFDNFLKRNNKALKDYVANQNKGASEKKQDL